MAEHGKLNVAKDDEKRKKMCFVLQTWLCLDATQQIHTDSSRGSFERVRRGKEGVKMASYMPHVIERIDCNKINIAKHDIFSLCSNTYTTKRREKCSSTYTRPNPPCFVPCFVSFLSSPERKDQQKQAKRRTKQQAKKQLSCPLHRTPSSLPSLALPRLNCLPFA